MQTAGFDEVPVEVPRALPSDTDAKVQTALFRQVLGLRVSLAVRDREHLLSAANNFANQPTALTLA